MKKIRALLILFHITIIFISINTTVASEAVKLPSKVEEPAIPTIVCELITVKQQLGTHNTIYIVASLVIVLILHMMYSSRKRKTCFRSRMYWLITIMIYLPSLLIFFFFNEFFLTLLSNILGGDGLEGSCPAQVDYLEKK